MTERNLKTLRSRLTRYKLIAVFAFMLPSVVLAHDPIDDINTRLDILENDMSTHTHPLPEHTHDVIPPPDPDPGPDPTPGNVPEAIANMQPGTWLEYGQPWEATAPYDWLDQCIPGWTYRFRNVIEAWNGWARDGLNYAWMAAGGGHADSCDNGVYRYNIQTGEMEVVVPHVPLNADLDTSAPYVADANGNQILPRSSHTFNLVVQDADWVYVMVGSYYSLGSFSKQVWRFHKTNHNWERLPDRGISGGDYHLLQTPDSVLFLGQWALCDVDLVAGSYDNCANSFHFRIQGTPAWDSGRNGLWFVNPHPNDTRVSFYHRNNGVWEEDIGLATTMPTDVAADLAPGTGVCVVPDGSILLWSKSSKLHRWDGMAWDTLTPPGGPTVARSQQSKWSWDNDAQACIGASHANTGLWVYKPVLGSTPPPDPTPGASNFDERCNAPGVVFCDPIDVAGPWGVDASGTRRLMPNPDGSEGIPSNSWWQNWRGLDWVDSNSKPELDTTTGESGGSLRMTIKSGSGSGGAGVYTTNFSDDLSQRFAEGDTFFVQYRVRYSCTAMYMDCDPNSPTYKTEPRLYENTSGGHTSFKVSIVGAGDPYAENIGKSTNSCTDLEMVTIRNEYGNFSGYHNCGWYAAWNMQARDIEGFPDALPYQVYGYDYVDNVSRFAEGDGWTGRIEGGLFCPLGPWQDENGVWQEQGTPAPTCFDADSDEWITIQMQVTIGTWQPDAVWPPNSHVKMWAAREGEPQILLNAADYFNRGPVGNEYPDANYYGKVWLLPHLLRKNPDEVHPEAYVWYDSLIVSTEFIADPE